MAGLTVVYDSNCPLCRRCRQWVLAQSQLVSFRFVAASEPWVVSWLGSLVPVGDELVVVDDQGAVWVGPDAFIVCLWGLTRYRSLARRLQRPGAKTLAKQAFHLVSSGRSVASLFIKGDTSAEGLESGSNMQSYETECSDRSCSVPADRAQ